MQITLQHSISLQLRQEQSISGGVTGSIFKKLEEKLLSDTIYQKALKFVGRRKDMNRYWSMIDFLFCELFHGWQSKCFAFYGGEGPQLREQISKHQCEEYESMMLSALECAKAMYEDEKCRGWSQFSGRAKRAYRQRKTNG